MVVEALDPRRRKAPRLAGKEKPTVSGGEPWVFRKNSFCLWSENFHRWDGADVGLACSALSSCTLEDSRADHAAATSAGIED